MNLLRMKKTLAWVLFSALLLPILAACGGTAAPATTASTAASTAAAAPSVAAETSAAASEAAEPSMAASEAASAAASAAGGTGTTDTGSAEPGVLRLNVGSEPDTIDPQKASFVGEIQFIMMNYQPLMTFDQDMKPIPGAAESMEVSEDGLTYTFKLPADAQYSNGDPLTAQNFVYAFQRLADPETAGEYQTLLCGTIKGYSEYSAAACGGQTITETLELDLETLRNNLGVRAVDDQTLEIQLENPAPYFPSMMALWIGAPVREEDVAAGEDWWYDPETYIGNGPFQLVEWEHDARAVWEANPNWRLGPIKLERVEYNMINESQVAFQAYQSGELDIGGVAAEDLATVQADPQLSQQVIEVPGSCTFYLGFNNTKAPFDNKQVRQAFAQAIDREAWVRDVLQGQGSPTQTFIPPGFPGYEETDQWSYNPEAARQALADAGFANGQGLPEIKLTFSSSARNQVRYEWLASQFRENLGIDVVLDPVDPTAYTALTKDLATTPQMYILGWCADYPDPQNWLSTVFKTGGIGAGRIGYSNPEFDRLVDQADRTPPGPERDQLYSQAQNILIEDAPVVFFWNNPGRMLVKPYVKGVTEETVTPLDYIPGFFNLQNLEVAP